MFPFLFILTITGLIHAQAAIYHPAFACLIHTQATICRQKYDMINLI
jgi:hypothetical protein